MTKKNDAVASRPEEDEALDTEQYASLAQALMHAIEQADDVILDFKTGTFASLDGTATTTHPRRYH